MAKKLLVADDSLTIQKVIRLALSNEGYDIQAVSDGNDAVQQISVLRPDIVLIDVSLPNQSAFEVKRAVNEQPDLQHVRFVLMSSAFENVDEAQAEEVEFHGRLTKPFDPAHLREVLVDVLSKAPAKNEAVLPFKRPAGGTVTPVHHEFEPALESEASSPALELPEFSLPDEPVEASEFTAPQVAETAPPQQEGDDIRKLTESTIRMSGLDDFEWSVQEPSLKPPSQMADHGDSNFPLHAPPAAPAAASTLLNTPLFVPPPPPSALPPEDDEVQASPAQPAFEPAPQTALPRTATAVVAPEEIEALVRQQVEESLARMAQALLPQIAERVIKEEIHRMLSEHP